MSRYPTNRNGLARQVQELGLEVVEQVRGKTNNHHLQSPRVDYQRTMVAQWVRGLVPHVQTMWIPEHNRLHKQYSPPAMPSNSQMVDCLDEYMFNHGLLNVVCERTTNHVYQVNQEQYERYRDAK